MPLFDLKNVPSLSAKSLLYPYVNDLYRTINGQLIRNIPLWVLELDDEPSSSMPSTTSLPTSSSIQRPTNPNIATQDTLHTFIPLSPTSATPKLPPLHHAVVGNIFDEIDSLNQQLLPALVMLVSYDVIFDAFPGMIDSFKYFILEISLLEASQAINDYLDTDKVSEMATGLRYHKLKDLYTKSHILFKYFVPVQIQFNYFITTIKGEFNTVPQDDVDKYLDIIARLTSLFQFDEILLYCKNLSEKLIRLEPRLIDDKLSDIYAHFYTQSSDVLTIMPQVLSQTEDIVIPSIRMVYTSNIYIHLYMTFLTLLPRSEKSEDTIARLEHIIPHIFSDETLDREYGYAFWLALRTQSIKLLALNINKDDRDQVEAYHDITKKIIYFLFICHSRRLYFDNISSLDIAFIIMTYNKLIFGKALASESDRSSSEITKKLNAFLMKISPDDTITNSAFYQLYVLSHSKESKLIEKLASSKDGFAHQVYQQEAAEIPGKNNNIVTASERAIVEKKIFALFKEAVESHITQFNDQGIENFCRALIALTPKGLANKVILHLRQKKLAAKVATPIYLKMATYIARTTGAKLPPAFLADTEEEVLIASSSNDSDSSSISPRGANTDPDYLSDTSPRSSDAGSTSMSTLALSTSSAPVASRSDDTSPRTHLSTSHTFAPDTSARARSLSSPITRNSPTTAPLRIPIPRLETPSSSSFFAAPSTSPASSPSTARRPSAQSPRSQASSTTSTSPVDLIPPFLGLFPNARILYDALFSSDPDPKSSAPKKS